MTSKRIERLRDTLLERGKPTLHPASTRALTTVVTPEWSALAERVRPFAEAMYLVLAADSAITDRERALLRGALRSLTDGAISSSAMNDMLCAFEHDLLRDGLDMRLDYVASALYSDRADARLALGLATAAADADRGVGPEEHALIDALGERLGIERSELQEWLQDSAGV